MAEGNGGDRISVSREILRAELAELELRLVNRFAEKSYVQEQERRLRIVEARVEPGALQAAVQGVIRQDDAVRWSFREKIIAIGLFVLSVSTFMFTVVSRGLSNGGN